MRTARASGKLTIKRVLEPGLLSTSALPPEKWRQVLSLNEAPPEYRVKCLTNQGVALASLGRMEDAIPCFQAILSEPDVAPDFIAEAHYNTGIAHMNLGRLHDAIACYDKVVVLAPVSEPYLQPAIQNREICVAKLAL